MKQDLKDACHRARHVTGHFLLGWNRLLAKWPASARLPSTVASVLGMSEPIGLYICSNLCESSAEWASSMCLAAYPLACVLRMKDRRGTGWVMVLNGVSPCLQLTLSGTWVSAEHEGDWDMAFAMLRHAPGVKHLIMVHALYEGASCDRAVCPQPYHCQYKIWLQGCA